MHKCTHPEGVEAVKILGHSLDPCVYREIEKYKNVTVVISQCEKCGNIDISWYRQEDTEEVDLDYNI